jgi:hypothetical protein
MVILVLKILTIWSALAFVTGLGLGAAIQRSDRIRKDEFLTRVFAIAEALQTSRG